MKAPDKIYVEVCEDGIFAFPEPPFAESVEYVRADLVKPTPDEPTSMTEEMLEGKIEGNPAKVTLIPHYGLEDEIIRYYYANLGMIIGPRNTKDIVATIARHFAEWGAEHLRDSTKMIPEGMEEAAEEWAENEAYGKSDAEFEMAYKGFIAGAEWQKAKMMEKTISWLKANANKYIVDIGVGYGEHGRNVELVVGGKCWDDLKKAMEEQK